MLLKRKNPINLREIIIVTGIFLTAFILGNIYDFNIAEKINSLGNANAFAVTMSAIAEFPVIIALCVGGCLCIAGRPTKCKKFWTVATIIFGTLGLLSAIYFCFDTFKFVWEFDHLSFFDPTSSDFSNPLILIIAIVVTLAMLVGCYFFYKKVTPKVDKRVMLMLGVFLLVMSGTVAVFTTVLKYVWSRPRPYYVFNVASDPINAFCYLYQLNPLYAFKADVSDYFKSFPSGHTTYASLAMFLLPMLTLLSEKRKNDRKLQIALFYAGLFWVLIVALSRMLASAHFLSDVSGTVLICLLLVFIEKTILFKLKSKNEVIKE